MHKAMDIVLPEPKTKLEAWNRWMNSLQTQMLFIVSSRRPIKVSYIDGKKLDADIAYIESFRPDLIKTADEWLIKGRYSG